MTRLWGPDDLVVVKTPGDYVFICFKIILAGKIQRKCLKKIKGLIISSSWMTSQKLLEKIIWSKMRNL